MYNEAQIAEDLGFESAAKLNDAVCDLIRERRRTYLEAVIDLGHARGIDMEQILDFPVSHADDYEE